MGENCKLVTMSDSSSLYRVSIYTAALDIIRHYWVTGIGIGAFNQILSAVLL